MQKLILSYFVAMISISVAATTSVDAQPATEYIDSTSPQVIEKISGNIVTFRNVAGESLNYYVPDWMIDKYTLKVGTSANLYNRNIVQGIYRNRYIETVNPGLLNVNAFALHDAQSDCLMSERYGTQDLAPGKRVWFNSKDCPSTIPIVGSMSFYQPKSVASSEESDRRAIVPPSIIDDPASMGVSAP